MLLYGDDFFKLGGNSILAIKLISKLNKKLKSHIKVADVFVSKNIASLSLKIIQSKEHYQTIVKLNTTSDKPNMFMIHPGTGGCEAYTSLAQMLNGIFTCYGIDNYNLHSDKKIESLSELASYYLRYMEEIHTSVNPVNREYHILGWSLGGVIALEIANILERRGAKNIKLYIIDSFIYDTHLKAKLKEMNELDKDKTKNSFIQMMESEGYDPEYIKKVVTNMDSEERVMSEDISANLQNTKILLFKAGLKDPKFGTIDAHREIYDYTKNLTYNNIDKILGNTRNISVVTMRNYHHRNILSAEDILVKEISRINKF